MSLPQLKLKYSPEGYAVTDFAAEDFVLKYRKMILEHAPNCGLDVPVGNEIVFYTARALYAEGKLEGLSLVFETEDGIEIPVNADGTQDSWPLNFCDRTSDILRRLTAVRMRK